MPSSKRPQPTLPPEVVALADPQPPAYEKRTRLPKRLPDDPVVYMDTVTPAMAATWLLHCNKNNRPERTSHINGMAEDLAADNFAINGETIKFDDEGQLMDGQNRLYACVLSGKSFRTAIVEHLKHVTVTTVDAGAVRTLAHDLHMRGEANAPTLAALLLRVVIWQRCKDMYGEGNYFRRVPSIHATKPQMLSLMYHPGGKAKPEAAAFREAAAQGAEKTKRIGMPGSGLAFCYWLFSTVDDVDAAEDAKFMYEKLYNGTDPIATDPLHVVKTMFDDRKSLLARDRPNEDWYAAILIKAWNAYRTSRPVQRITFKQGGANPERFPQPI